MNMELIVKTGMSTSSIEKLVNTAYPFLKIKLNAAGKANLIHDFVLQKGKQSLREFSITPNMTVLRLQTEFLQHFNIDATVYRKTGESWVQIGVTADWTLNFQNLQGELTNVYL